MGSLWRSEQLELVQIFLPEELVHGVVHSLGDEELLQFVDVSRRGRAAGARARVHHHQRWPRGCVWFFLSTSALRRS